MAFTYPSDSKASTLSNQPYWNTITSTPYAAATESRFITTALSGSRTERSSRNSTR
jgi:hypothetical protein